MQLTDDGLEAWQIEDLPLACDTVILSTVGEIRRFDTAR